MNHPLSDEAILKLISDKSFIGCCDARARCFHNNFINNQLCTEEIDVNAAIKAFRPCREETRMLTVLERNSFLLGNFKESIKPILLSDSTSLDEFINGPLYTSGAQVDEVDVDTPRNPKRRKLIHQACRRASGRVAADQELINNLSTELERAMQELQESNDALDNCQQSKVERPAPRIRSSTTRADRGTGKSPPGNDYSLGRERGW